MKYVIIVGLMVFNMTLSVSQGAVELSREDIKGKVLDQNFDLLLAQYEVDKSKGSLKSANALTLPDINLSYSGITTDNPLMAFGSRLNQERVTAMDFDPNLLNDPDRIENFTTMVEIRQPILNFDLKYYKDAARTKLEATEWKIERLKDGLSLQADQLYLQLQLTYKQLDVLEVAKRTVDETYRVAQQQFDQGLMQRSDLLAIGVRVKDLENQILNADNQILLISRRLSLLMNEPMDGSIIPSEELVQNVAEKEGQNISESRADFMAMKKASEAYRLQYEGMKKGSMPRLNGFANYAFNDNSPVKFRGEGYLIGLQLSWNVLGNKKSEGKVQESQAAYQESLTSYQKMLAENETELYNTLRKIDNAEASIQLAQQALDQAEESLRIRKNRFDEGLERTADLLQSEAQFAEKQMQYHHAVFQYNMAVNYLQFLTKE
jgi:outer membrane protein TolC